MIRSEGRLYSITYTRVKLITYCCLFEANKIVAAAVQESGLSNYSDKFALNALFTLNSCNSS